MKPKRLSYREAVEWIAVNDEPTETNPETLASLISVALIADLSARDPKKVAQDVLRARKQEAP